MLFDSLIHASFVGRRTRQLVCRYLLPLKLMEFHKLNEHTQITLISFFNGKRFRWTHSFTDGHRNKYDPTVKAKETQQHPLVEL